MFAFLCYKTVDKFIADKTLVRMSKRQYKVNEIPFPAITFCPDMVILGHNISAHRDLQEMIFGYWLPLKNILFPIEYFRLQQFYEDFNFSAVSWLPELKRRAQLKWFTNCVFIEWMGQYSVSVSMVITRHGFCYSFNMQPIENLLRFEKWASEVSFDFLNSYFSFGHSVAEAFQQTDIFKMTCVDKNIAKFQIRWHLCQIQWWIRFLWQRP